MPLLSILAKRTHVRSYRQISGLRPERGGLNVR